MRVLVTLFIAALWGGSVSAQSSVFSFEFEELADGVWAGVRPDSPRFPVMGNTTFAISNEGVVVYDGGGVPLMAEQIIEKVRSLTDKPVTHVVISHWHGDHNFGVYRFAEEFPDVKFVTHRFTAEVFDSPRIAYIDRSATFVERNIDELNTIIETGKTSEGEAVSAHDMEVNRLIVKDIDLLESEYKRVRVVRPDVIIEDKLVIQSGNRRIEIMYLGDANTEGDLVMWLPEERIVATGDIVVLPSPYAFNVPPRAWAETMENINALDYAILVPGHGPVQHDTAYVDLTIEAARSIADQRDALLAEGMAVEEVETALDFSGFEERFTDGDEYVKVYYDAFFERPFRKAAMKVLKGEPMVVFDGPEKISLDDERWIIESLESERLNHLGQDALRLKGGYAMLAGLDVKNGIVEFDMAVEQVRGFAGLIFRVQDPFNYEHFYIRPHQSGNSDANQYTPVFNGISAWQLYHGPEYASPTSYEYNKWMHVKVVFAGTRADVYIDSDVPVLRINDLKRGPDGGLAGVNSANFSSAYFANVQVARLADAYVLPSRELATGERPERQIETWSVSETFDADLLQDRIAIAGELRAVGNWQALDSEVSGILNLASVPLGDPAGNARFARVILNSDKEQTRQLRLGYSDKASVFVNGELRYAGDNTYQSRDYRYLGTIGLFDTVALPLKKGDNEILIGVTEAFGGWGIMGELDSLEGLQVR